jgi:hypothetical protein
MEELKLYDIEKENNPVERARLARENLRIALRHLAVALELLKEDFQ